MTDSVATIHLKPKAHTRLTRGHLWVFSNEIDRLEGEPEAGAEVRVLDAAGRLQGSGTHNPHTLIAVRLHSRVDERLDGGLIRRRLSEAVTRRRALWPGRTCWRAAHSEGDLLPGLIVDRLGDVAVMQILTAAMEVRRSEVIAAIEEILQPEAIFERSDSPHRGHEGLEPRVGPVVGEALSKVAVSDPPGVQLEVPLAEGQKTGLYLDHAENRLMLQGRVDGARVLDMFCYVGQWSCCAAVWGAESVTAVDSSGEAIGFAEGNARLNGVGERCQFQQADAFEALREMERSRATFDVIILDPPAFAKSRKQVKGALRGYKEINLRAMRILAPGGLLLTASCSHHVSEEDFRELLVQAARNAGRSFAVEAPLRQGADHPILLGHPETAYLKGNLLRATG
jgi:23S rRNA (cytosine1962-C5)-methyltransferase